MNLFEFTEFSKFKEENAVSFTFMFDRKINIEDIESILEIEDLDLLYLYSILKNSLRTINFSSSAYDTYTKAFSKFFSGTDNQLYLNVFRDVFEIPCDDSITFSFKCALLQTFIKEVYANRFEITCYSELIEHLIQFLNSNSLQNIIDTEEQDLMNIRLDYLLTSLQIVLHFVETKIKRNEKLERRNFLFSKKYFDESFLLVKTSEYLENDIVFIFRTSFSIYALLNEDCIDEAKEILLSKYFMIGERSMLEIQKQVVYTFSLCKGFKYILYLILNSDAIVYQPKNNRMEFINFTGNLARKTLKKSEIMELENKTFNDIMENKEEFKSTLIENFLEFINQFEYENNFWEVNYFFVHLLKSNNKDTNIIKSYADFLYLNEVNLPVHSFLKEFGVSFIITFYSYFFKNAKRNEARKSKDTTDRAILDFFKYFLEQRKNEYVQILNTIPYIPPSKENYHIIYQTWAYLLKNSHLHNMTFFFLKTPALIGIADSIFTETGSLSEIAKCVGLPKTMKPEKILFLAIIYFSEKHKLSNFNYTGIIEYITDEKTIKAFKDDLPLIIQRIHEEQNYSVYEFNLSYAYSLLQIASKNDTFLTTLKIILIILKSIIMKEKKIKFVKKIHFEFKKIFDTYHSLSYGEKHIVIEEYAIFYKTILNELSTTAVNFFNYIVLCVADLSLFGKDLLFSFGHRSFSELYQHTYSTMAKIENFPLVSKEGEIQEDDKMLWLVDVVYLRHLESNTIRSVFNLLKRRLDMKFDYTDLYILLKAYNILGIREEGIEALLKKIINRGIDFKTESEIFKKLSEETEGFYKFYFGNIFYVVKGTETKAVSFPHTEQDFSIFNYDELVDIHNIFRKRILFDFLSKTNLFSCYNYFLYPDKMGLLDAITVVKRSKSKDWIKKALDVIKNCGSNFENRKLILFYIPQLIQCLRKADVLSEVFLTLLELAKDEIVCHQLIWNLNANLFKDEKKIQKDHCYEVFSKCINDLMLNLTNEQKERYENEVKFFRSLTNISSSMMPYLKSDKDVKKKLINAELKNVEVYENVYLPTDPENIVVDVVENSGRVLQSHAKVPFMASFKVKNQQNEISTKNVIFKFGDDCRQDMLALQLITLFKEIFEDANLDLSLFPYKVIATESGCGLIEVIPNAISRDQMGREKINNLSEYFEFKFGFKESETYLKALDNFVSSFAAYSLVVYFLNIKDRHNGNIMIDDEGRMIHIDFGYMFEISPGNLNLEVPLKLTAEIFQLLGGVDGRPFKVYQELMIKGFYSLRRRSKEIIFMVDSFLESGLPCYRKNAIDNFISRFKFSLSDEEVRTFLISLISSSSRKVRTWVYDKFQEMTNNIAF